MSIIRTAKFDMFFYIAPFSYSTPSQLKQQPTRNAWMRHLQSIATTCSRVTFAPLRDTASSPKSCVRKRVVFAVVE
nr:unnamed protein product [Haemonchus contortus]